MNVHRTQLKNGLTLLLSPLNQTKAVTVLVLLPVGSRHERKDINGVSHFVEHLMFKGTKQRPTSLDITKEIDAVGAEYNAFTAKDQTGYYVKLASDKIELAFDILSDMLFNSVFDAKEIDKERGVIVEEINMYEDNPMIYIGDVLEEVLFSGNSLSWHIAGPRQVIKTVPRQKIIDYRDHFYAPSSMIVTVSGRFDATRVKKLAEKYFGLDRRRLKKNGTTKFTTNQAKPQINIFYKKTEQVNVALGFLAYALSDPRQYALQLLSIILGGNMSSRLFINIREKHGLCYFIRSAVDAYQDIGALIVQAGLDRGRINQAITLILAELSRLKREGVTAKELADAQQFLKGKLVLELEDSEAVAGWVGKQQLLLNKVITPEQHLKKIFAVSRGDIKKIAGEVIQARRLSLAMIGPFKDKQPFARLLKV